MEELEKRINEKLKGNDRTLLEGIFGAAKRTAELMINNTDTLEKYSSQLGDIIALLSEITGLLRDHVSTTKSPEPRRSPLPAGEISSSVQTQEKLKSEQQHTSLFSIPRGVLDELDRSEDDEHVFLHPKKFLGKERFLEVTEALKDAGFKYVSAGRDSHWERPK